VEKKQSTTSVADPHHLDADPDSTFHFDADPDPACHFDADPDPSLQINAQKVTLNKCSNRLIFYTFWLVICKLFRIWIQIFTLMRIRIQCIQYFGLSSAN
jgi:hypothetical protein